MVLSEQQYRRVARYLDGEDLVLTAVEQSVADEILGDEAALAGVMTGGLPPGALERVWRRTAAERARPRRRILRIASLVGAAAAAAALLVATILTTRRPPPRPHARVARTDGQAPRFVEDPLPSEELLRLAREAARDDEIEFLTQQVAELEAELLVAVPPPAVDVDIESLQQEVDEFWADELPPTDSL